MRRISIIIISIICSCLYSQEFSFGIRGGFNFNSIDITEHNSKSLYNVSLQNTTAYGIVSELSFEEISLQLEIIFNKLQFSLDFENLKSERVKEDNNLKNMNYAFLLKYKIPVSKKFDTDIFIGPILSSLYENVGKDRLELRMKDPNVYITLGFELKFRFDKPIIFLDIRYVHGLTDNFASVKSDCYFQGNLNSINFSAGLLFPTNL